MDILRRYLSRDGRLRLWPKHQRVPLVLDWLAGKFEPDREYSEKEVNNLLNEAHTFKDPAFLRRVLIEYGYFEREPDGTRYRLVNRPI